MQDEARALVVRHVVGLDAHALGLDQPPDRLDAGEVGAVAEPDRHRRVVEPEAVAAVGVRGLLERPEHGDAEPLELGGDRRRLGLPRRLGHPQRDRAAARDQHRVVHVDGVDLAVERLGDLDRRARARRAARRTPRAGGRAARGRARATRRPRSRRAAPACAPARGAAGRSSRSRRSVCMPGERYPPAGPGGAAGPGTRYSAPWTRRDGCSSSPRAPACRAASAGSATTARPDPARGTPLWISARMTHCFALGVLLEPSRAAPRYADHGLADAAAGGRGGRLRARVRDPRRRERGHRRPARAPRRCWPRRCASRRAALLARGRGRRRRRRALPRRQREHAHGRGLPRRRRRVRRPRLGRAGAAHRRRG